MKAALAAAIFLLAALTFLPSLENAFVTLDDGLYVYDNELVRGGLTRAGVVTAFSEPACNFYHPLTMLSLMLDHQIWGLVPAGFRFTNILLHACSAVLLFLVLRQMTGALWRSAFVAAVFAVHPLRVESVVWIAERKDVLSTLFFMLTLGAYAAYARRPALGRYVAVLVVFSLGLLAKPSLVTLPCVLLLLDHWPLKRLPWSAPPPERWRAGFRLVVEKLPLFVLAALASWVAVGAQSHGVIPYENHPLILRLQNAPLAVVTYVGQTFNPLGLAAHYPFPAAIAAWKTAAAVLGVAAVTTGAVACFQRRPAVFIGWFWFLGMLVPMLGIVQVGTFAHADRFTYLPQIGLLIALAWGAHEATVRWAVPRTVVAFVAAGIVAACGFFSLRQAAVWADSVTLFRHALAVTRENGLAHGSLGFALLEQWDGKRFGPAPFDPAVRREAIGHFREAVRLLPHHPDTHLNLGLTLNDPADRDEAITHLRTAVRSIPQHTGARLSLGLLLAERGDVGEATAQLEETARLAPGNLFARNNLGSIYRRQGRFADAIAQYREILRRDPDFADARNNLGIALFESGDETGGIREFWETLRREPAHEGAARNLEAVRP